MDGFLTDFWLLLTPLSKALRAQVGPGLWVAGGNLNGAARSDLLRLLAPPLACSKSGV
jgi:hypothetical protein